MRCVWAALINTDTTHLMLQRTTSPLALPPFLALALPLAARLAILDISHCALVELPVALASCTKLRELDISGNHFCELPSFLATLLSLRVLIVNDCALESLPSLASLHKLRTLSLRANRMRSLPSWLCRLDKLDKLLVDDNPFSGQWQVVVQPILSPVTISAPELPPATVRPAPKSLNLRSSSYADLSHTLRTPPLVAKRSEGNLRASPTAGYDFVSRRRSKSAAAPLTGSAISPSAATLSLSLASSTRSSVLDAASSPAPSTARSSPVSESRKWGKMFRKASGGKPDSRRVSDPPVPPRTLSKKASSTSTFRRRVLSLAPSKSAPSSPADEVPPVPPMPSQEQLRSKRTSLLRVDPTSPISTWAFREAPSPAAASFAAPLPPADPAAGLRSVIAYLRDVDDLSPAPTLDLALALAPPTPLSAKSRQSQYFSDGVSVVSPLSRPTSLQSTASFRPDRAKAMRVVQEIIETERSYVLALTELSEVYIAPASVVVAPGSIGKSGRKPEETMVPAIERRAVFGNIVSLPRPPTRLTSSQESITALHRTILAELLVAGASSEDVAGAVASVFIRHFRPSMKIYNTYVTSFDAALSRIVHWMDATPTAGRATGAAPSLLPALTVPQKKRIRSYLKVSLRAHAGRADSDAGMPCPANALADQPRGLPPPPGAAHPALPPPARVAPARDAPRERRRAAGAEPARQGRLRAHLVRRDGHERAQARERGQEGASVLGVPPRSLVPLAARAEPPQSDQGRHLRTSLRPTRHTDSPCRLCSASSSAPRPTPTRCRCKRCTRS